jgi:hypothetical protein
VTRAYMFAIQLAIANGCFRQFSEPPKANLKRVAAIPTSGSR